MNSVPRLASHAFNLKTLATTLLLALLCAQAAAQQGQTAARPDRGVNPGGAYAVSDVENVSLQNGNVNLSIPLASLPPMAGGKLSLTVRAYYNSKLWNVVREEAVAGSPEQTYVVDHPQLSDAGGWSVGAGYLILRRDGHTDFDYQLPLSNEGPENQRLSQHSWWKFVVRTPDGAEHELIPTGSGFQVYGDIDHPRSYLWGFHTAYPTAATGPLRYETVDGTYISAVYNPPDHPSGVNWTLFLPDGTQVIDYTSGIQRIRDANGNQIKIYTDGEGTHYQDEHLPGREIKVLDIPGGAPGGYDQKRVSYKTVGGVWQHVYVNYGVTTVRGKIYKVSDWNPTAYGETGQQGAACTHQKELVPQDIPVVREIVFPETEPGQNSDARRFSFSYNSDTTETATTQHFSDVCGQSSVTYTRPASPGMGALSHMETPTGAKVDYLYTLATTHDFTGLVGTTDRLTRETITDKYLDHDGVVEPDHWHYDIPYDGVGSTSTVTNPDGSKSYISYYQRHPDNPRGVGTGDLLAGRVFYESNGLTQTHRRWAMRGTTYATGTDGFTALNPYVEAEYTTLLDNNEPAAPVKMSAKTYEYDFNGNVTKVTEYDWFDPIPQSARDSAGIPNGVPAGAKVLRVTDTSYYNQAASDSSQDYYRLRGLTTGTPSFLGAVKETTAGASRTRISYDGQAWGAAPTSGNVTQVSRLDDKGDADAGNDTWVTTSTTYGDYGNPSSTTDANVHTTYLYYDDETHALPTRVVVNPLNNTGTQTTATTYDPSTGLVTSATDPNNQVSTVDYTNRRLNTVDPLGRPGMTRSPAGTDAGGATVYRKTYTYYDDATRHVRTVSDLNTEGDGLLQTQTTADELGRVVLAEQNEGGSTYTISARTVYALAGRVTMQSSPARGNTTPESWTRVTKDVYGRVTEAATFGGGAQPPPVTDPANPPANWTGSVKTSYWANQTTVTDQAGRQRRSVSDALGRLVRVDEPDKDTGALDDQSGNPVQPTAYTYDALGNLRKVEQGGQLRFFMYDSLGRLIRAKNPEQGSISTDADFPALTDASSGTSNSQWSTGYRYDAAGNLWKRKDARGVVTTYGYDGLNRNTSVSYSGETGTQTPAVTRTYDEATRGKGRPWKSEAAGTGQTTVETYDAAGRPLGQSQKFWVAGAWGTAYSVGYTYDLAGGLKTQTYPSGHSVSYAYDSAGRLNSFAGNLGDGMARTYADTFSYDAAGRTTQERYGTQTPVYNKHLYNSRGQLAEIRVSTYSLTSPGHETDWNRGALINHYSNSGWGASGGGSDNNGNLKKQDVYIPDDDAISCYSQTTSFYDYDALNRLRQVREARDGSNLWLQQYDYDRWGNRAINASATQVYGQNPGYSIPEPQFTVDTNTNRLGVPSGQSGQMAYDAAGNLTLDTYQGGQNVGGGARTYDAENRMTAAGFFAGQAQTAAYTYDADGRRVKRMVGTPSEAWQVYGAGGELLAEYAPGAAPAQPQKEYGYRAGELLVTAESGTAGGGSSGGAPTTGLVGYWKFDENSGTTAADSSGGNHPGTLQAGAGWAAGASGPSASLDGADDYVQVGAGVPAAGAGLTVSAWVYPTGGGVTMIVNKEGEYELMRFPDGTIRWAIANQSPGWTSVDTGLVAPPNEWTHVTFTYDGASAKTYVGGQPAHTASAAGAIGDVLPGMNELRIGGRQESAGYTWAGRLDEVRVYNRALSAGEVGGLYSAGQPQGGGASSSIRWLVTDQLGTPRMVVDETGSLAGVTRHDYLPFGDEIAAGVGGRMVEQGYSKFDGLRQKFTGSEHDEIGFDFMQARYYGSTQGRFTSPDPFGPWAMTEAEKSAFLNEPQQWGRYTYVTNNPLKYTDPTGLERYGDNVDENARKIIHQALLEIASHGSKKQKAVANYILKNDVLVTLNDKRVSRGIISDISGAQAAIQNGYVAPGKAAKFLELKVDVNLVNSKSEYAAEELQTTLVHEGKHTYDNAQLIAALSAGVQPGNYPNTTVYDGEHVAYLMHAQYLLRRGNTFVDYGLKNYILKKEGGSIKVNEQNIRDILKLVYRVTPENPGFRTAEIYALHPRQK